jgi:hypothetical protein
VLSLLAAAAETQPLLVWVDDAHWVDAESAGALGFCARRLYAEPVLLVLAARAGERLPLASDGFELLALGGLDAAASAELVAAACGRGVDARVAGRLQAATGGNPLALLEVGGLLSDAQLAGRAALEEPLRVGSAVERLFGGGWRGNRRRCSRRYWWRRPATPAAPPRSPQRCGQPASPEGIWSMLRPPGW